MAKLKSVYTFRLKIEISEAIKELIKSNDKISALLEDNQKLLKRVVDGGYEIT